MTSMGIGFTLGPLAGGLVAKAWGYTASYYLLGLGGPRTVWLGVAPSPIQAW